MADFFTVKAVFQVEDAKGKIKKQTDEKFKLTLI